MRLKVISDGTQIGTNVVNSETNERVELIQKISWESVVNNLPTVTITFLASEIDINSSKPPLACTSKVNKIIKTIPVEKDGKTCNIDDVIKALQQNLNLS